MTPREAVCQYMGWDNSDAADYRYHYGRTSMPVYATEGGFVCCVKTGRKPPKYASLDWKEAEGSEAKYAQSFGKTIFISE